MHIPSDRAKLASFAKDLIDTCRQSQGRRAALYRSYNSWIETGRAENSGRAWSNRLYAHVDRLQSNLFSPTNLKFTIDFERHYDKSWLAKAEVVARKVTRTWEQNNIDVAFSEGVGASLAYGAAILKQKGRRVSKESVTIDADLVMPWQFSVLREDKTSLDDQEAFVQSTPVDENEVWSRIRNLPDAVDLLRRFKAHSQKGGSDDGTQSFFHQIVSTSTLGVPPNTSPTRPGGIVQLSTAGTNGIMAPEMNVAVGMLHELWVKDSATGDYVTIQLVDPDIILAPSAFMVAGNLFAPGIQPFTPIRSNSTPGFFWGRSEIVDLIQIQELRDTSIGDIRRILGVQFDKLLAFSGADGISDEAYDQFRTNGYMNLGPNGRVEDLTPPLPQNAFQWLDFLERESEAIAGFDNIMSGRGETGVRTGIQTSTLARYASPRLRDRALLLERQCASAADITLSYLEAKNGEVYWTDVHDARTDFNISGLMEDRRISVDSHSSSPIYEEDHANLMMAGLKGQFITGESMIDFLPYPHKDVLHQRLSDKEAAQAKLIQEHPEILTKGKR